MDLITGNAADGPFVRNKHDERADYDAIMVNISALAYRDWPNDAAFDGLTEQRGPIELRVHGTIPTWAAGSLYRTGPGIYKVEDTKIGTFYTSHWFDGLAQTHRFDIVPDGEGRVKMFYASRRQSDQLMEYIKETGQRKLFSFAQRRDPCMGLFAKIMSTWQVIRAKTEDRKMDNINVAVLPNLPGLEAVETKPSASHRRSSLPKTVWLTTDNCTMKQIDPETLEPVGFAVQSSLHPNLTGPMSCAHAQRDPESGDVFNFNLQLGRETIYRIFRVNASSGTTDILATIRGPEAPPAYIHSFFLTSNYVILCIPSSHLALRGLRVLWERNILDSMEPFDETRKCKWFVVDRRHGKGVVAQFETDAAFFFHSVNAFEDADSTAGTTEIFCDVVEYANLDIIHSLYYDVLLRQNGAEERFWGDAKRAAASMTNLTRYHIRIPKVPTKDDGAVSPAPEIEKVFAIPAPHSGELPTINPHYATKRHRYVYSLGFLGRSTLMDCIVKTDVATRDAVFWNIPQGHSPGEAIFVPRPNGTEEDDGILLSVVLDGETGTSYLLCLDAMTMDELGHAEVGFAVALGFHGVHVEAGGGM